MLAVNSRYLASIARGVYVIANPLLLAVMKDSNSC